ncbi:MAG TPA: LysE/ArgO family amino acid transporter [Micromonosporaceae bacterium]|nr:LysE/ArgO family amino acid transporter [Micromonosporaceae bacterium]
MLGAALAGLVTGLTLIVAIGAQNAYVLRQGLAREHIGGVVLVCTLSDVVLILSGVSGIGAIVQRAPWALEVLRWLGVAFLTWYGINAIVRARRSSGLVAGGGSAASRRSVLLRAFALTWLNPHVYLDTVVLLGSIANQGGQPGRWWFAAGACAASGAWFAALGYGAALAHRWLARPRVWRILDVAIGLTMLAIAVTLTTG